MTEETLTDPCTHAERHLQEYLDQVLCSQVAASIEAHLAVCAHCARAYAFEQRFRNYVRHCCAGGTSEEQCREEFRQKLEQRCRQIR